MNPGDTFPFEDFETPTAGAVTTAWSRFGSRKPIRRTYGRGGGEAVAQIKNGNDKSGPFRGFSEPSFISSSISALSESHYEAGVQGDTILAEEAEWKRMSRTSSVSSDSPRFQGGDSRLEPPMPQARRRFVRAHSVTGASPNEPTRGIPRSNASLKRSSSVSTSMFSSRNSSSSFLSASVASSLDRFGSEDRDNENYDPNYNPYHEDVSPKRLAKLKRNEARERIKVRSFSHQQQSAFTSRNDFAALESYSGDGSSCAQTAAAPESFSILARRHGEPRSAWAGTALGTAAPSPIGRSISHVSAASSLGSLFSSSPPFAGDNEDDDEEATVYSSASISMASSSRKRGLTASPSSDDDSPPSVPRAKSRIFSPQPSAPMSLERSLLLSVDSGRGQRHHDIMDVSIYPSSGYKKDRPVKEFMMSDDDDVNNVDDSIDNSSTDSDDNRSGSVPIAQSVRSRQASCGYSSRILVLEKASVDDIIKSMSSYEDLLFIVNELEREESNKNYAAVCWYVVPRKEWDSNRRNSFLSWTLEALGFRLNSLSANNKCINISKTKGKQLLNLLRSALNTCMERGIRGNFPSTNRKSSLQKEFSVPPVKGELRTRESIAGTEELTTNSLRPIPNDPLQESLLETMKNLNMNDKPIPAKAMQRLEPSFGIDRDFDNFSVQKPPRPSFEHHTSSDEFLANMHGVTPAPQKTKLKLPRTSLHIVAPAATTTYSCSSPFFASNVSKVNQPMSCTSNAILTPMMNASDDGWGENPITDRDWGWSEPCESELIDELLRRLNETGSTAPTGDSFYSAINVGETASASLHRDFEAASGFRDKADSPSSGSADYAGFDDSESSLVRVRNNSVVFEVPDIHKNGREKTRDERRLQTSFAKHRRISLFAAAVNPAESFLRSRKSLFIQNSHEFPSINLSPLHERPSAFFPAGKFQADNILTKKSERESPIDNNDILEKIFDFLEQNELQVLTSLVSRKWFDTATRSQANHMLSSVGCGSVRRGDEDSPGFHALNSSMQRPWSYLTSTFPWACFLSEGAYKRVYKVFNHVHRVEEAISVMDVEQIQSTGNMNVVGAELAVSVMLSSLVRRGICPNFVVTRGVFSSPFEPPADQWGSALNKQPKGTAYNSPKATRRLKEPRRRGRYQYIRMELCDEGDAEEFLKRQPDRALTLTQARHILFQVSFALHTAADRFSLKHYDMKLLNVFLQRIPTEKSGDVVLRYGLGQHVFSLRAPKETALFAKLADYGTANVDSTTNGQNVTIAQFTTLENTPPDFLILGDQARQGHGHDCFGLGLCMLHLFTGHAPYEEILGDVSCPSNLKNQLRKIWENEDEKEFSVIRSVVLGDVYKDEDGHVIEGEPDEVLYDTLYRFLVLFGVPDEPSWPIKSKVMSIVRQTLTPDGRRVKGRGAKRAHSDANKFVSDRRKYSLSHGNNQFIARARCTLNSMDGGMDLLLSLVHFNPFRRATALDVLNSTFMTPLRDISSESYNSESDEVLSYTTFSTFK